MIYKKYSFDSEAQAVELIDALAKNNHTLVKLGFLQIGDADEETPPTFSDKYSVDVLWKGLELDENENPIFPDGWVENELNGLSKYKHNFYGLTFEE